MSEKAGLRVGASMKGRRALIDVAILHLGKMRRVADVDTQAIRKKLLDRLDGLFELVDSRGDEDFQGVA